MADQNNSGLEILLETLRENPNLWETRKKTAELLFKEQQYMRAADIVWNAPEIPATDVDVAFALKMVSRVKPNRSIRLIYEIVRRNQNKPHKNIALARELNNVGMYLEAARFYGAALASDSSLFDLGFERQMLWLDDSGRLVEEWKKADRDSKPPLDVLKQEFHGGPIKIEELQEDSRITSTPPQESNIAPPIAAKNQTQVSSPKENSTQTAPPVSQPQIISPEIKTPTTDSPQTPFLEQPLPFAPLTPQQPDSQK